MRHFDDLVPLLLLCSSLVPGLVIFFLREQQRGWRTALNLFGALFKLVLIGVMMIGILANHQYQWRLPVWNDLDLVLRADALAMLFTSLSAFLWLLTTIYAIAYLEGSPHRSRFFGFFSLCVSSTMGIAMAGNLFTFVVFYEALTLTTYPLVVHRGTETALRAGRIYLAYTLTGGALLLAAVIWLRAIAGPVEFGHGSVLAALDSGHHPALRAIFALLTVGLGVKAALVPLHGWLPTAMVAPAPVSALLHAVAVVKAGAFGIVRVVYDVYGPRFGAELGVLTPLAVAACVTILWGSLRAVYQDDLKRRLAFSTVSQVAYIVLGVAVVGPAATLGGVIHLVHQGLMKITLFFCAGNLAETLGIHRVSEMRGVGRRMPWSMGAFTVAALAMIGMPPLAGFVTKWFLAVGSLEAGQPWVMGVLLASTALNAIYFLPIVFVAWFRPQHGPWPDEQPPGRWETHPWLLFPALITAAATILVGLFANTILSPLTWGRLIVERAYF